MEFGLGMSMAQQMTEMMNQTMQSMQTPESSRPVQPKAVEWYIAVAGKASGPYTENEVKSLLLEKKINNETLVWRAGMPEWAKAENTPQILKLLIQLPPSL